MCQCIVLGSLLLSNNEADRSRSTLVFLVPLLPLFHGGDVEVEGWREPDSGCYAGTSRSNPWRGVASGTFAPTTSPSPSFF